MGYDNHGVLFSFENREDFSLEVSLQRAAFPRYERMQPPANGRARPTVAPSAARCLIGSNLTGYNSGSTHSSEIFQRESLLHFRSCTRLHSFYPVSQQLRFPISKSTILKPIRSNKRYYNFRPQFGRVTRVIAHIGIKSRWTKIRNEFHRCAGSPIARVRTLNHNILRVTADRTRIIVSVLPQLDAPSRKHSVCLSTLTKITEKIGSRAHRVHADERTTRFVARESNCRELRGYGVVNSVATATRPSARNYVTSCGVIAVVRTTLRGEHRRLSIPYPGRDAARSHASSVVPLFSSFRPRA